MDYFEGGERINLMQVLDNREWREKYQKQLMASFPTAVITSVKLNLPGPIKTSPKLQSVFQIIINDLNPVFKDLQIIKEASFVDQITGPEIFFVTSGCLKLVKQIMITFEESHLLGRLLDLDVMCQNADKQLSREELGFAPRKCLLCGKDAKTCIKEGNHSLAEGYSQINKMLHNFEKSKMIVPQMTQSQVVNAALTGMLYEVSLAPKPGLVDPISNGAHKDMTVFTFIDSSLALQPYLNEAYRIGNQFKGTDLPRMFSLLRNAGIRAEKDMFAATNGVNTHKGAVFSLGIMVTAVAYATQKSITNLLTIQKVISDMTQDLVKNDLVKNNLRNSQNRQTAGERQFIKYKIPGVRGEAEKGFPIVMNLALPFLCEQQGNFNQRLLNTLMKIAGNIDDTNLIKRAGNATISKDMQHWSMTFFQIGGSYTPEGLKFLNDLDQMFIKRNLSMGGAADNLILTIFLARLVGSL